MNRNDELFERAQISIPGGVNSPVRAFRSVGGSPRFMNRAQGPYMWDVTGKRYADYILSWGPMILGHSHPDILKAVYDRMVCGLSFGAPTGSRSRRKSAVSFRQLSPSVSSPPAPKPA